MYTDPTNLDHYDDSRHDYDNRPVPASGWVERAMIAMDDAEAELQKALQHITRADDAHGSPVDLRGQMRGLTVEACEGIAQAVFEAKNTYDRLLLAEQQIIAHNAKVLDFVQAKIDGNL